MITLLTYDAPHRKTQDVAWRLLSHARKFKVVAIPWIDRKPRRFLYAHRPAEMTWPCEALGQPETVFANLGVDYLVCPSMDCVRTLVEDGPVVIGGAGILPKEVVENHDVLNVHPGLLPASRGLDILKWSILDLRRVGVTAHLCDQYTDLGWRILDRRVPVYHSDSFHSFAMRQYEMELDLIDAALELLETKTKDDFERIEKEDTEARRRMPRRKEAGLLEAFERFKLVYAK